MMWITGNENFLIYISVFLGLFFSLYSLFTLEERKGYIRSPRPYRWFVTSVIIPAYNEETTIAKTIESLLKLNYPKRFLDIIVVNDGSTDKTVEVAKKYERYGVRVFTKKNAGKGEAVNFGIARARGELVAGLDADAFVDPMALHNMIGFFDDPKVMAVTPSMRLVSPNNFLQRIQYIEYMVGVFLRKVFAFLGSVHVTPGPFTVFRKEFFTQYGGFDTTTIVEDQEIALRIQSLGYKIDNAMDAHVFTTGVEKFWPLYNQRIRWYRGFLDNIPRYKHLFSPRYGNLGLLVLPSALLSIGLTIALIIYTLWRFGVNGLRIFNQWAAVNYTFDHLSLAIDWFTLDIGGVTLLILIAVLLNAFSIWIAKKVTGENVPLGLSFIMYTFVYGFFFAHWWIASLYYKIAGRKIYWAGRWM